MKFFEKVRDGGKDSNVDSYFMFEFKNLFSLVIFKFNKEYRNTYHSHAFNALTWFISGNLKEIFLYKNDYVYKRSFIPKITKKSDLHIVEAIETSWAISIRGPWEKEWLEYDPVNNMTTVLSWGRKTTNVFKGSPLNL